MEANKTVVKVGSAEYARFLEPLTPITINEAEKEVLNDPVYGSQGDLRILKNVFAKHNIVDPIEVAIEIALIDITHNTQLGRHLHRSGMDGLRQMADFICAKGADIEKSISEGTDKGLLLIARHDGKTFNNAKFFSFASKYCCCVSLYKFNNDSFFMIDKNVRNILPYYLVSLDPSTFYSSDRKTFKTKLAEKKKDVSSWFKKLDYGSFSSAENSLIKGYKGPYAKRGLDHFFWYQEKRIGDAPTTQSK